MSNFLNIFVPMISIATFGFSGSLHCLGMCSPLVASCQRKTWQYFVSRALSYTIIGLLAGSIGAFIFKNFLDFSAKKLAIVIVIVCFIQIVFILRSNNNKTTGIALRFINFINKYSPFSQSATLGIITALLPCGFLYSAILMCAAFTNPFLSALGMFIFAVVTSPVLIGSKTVFHYLSKKSTKFYKYVSVFLLLLVAGLALMRGGFFKSETENKNDSNTHIDCH